MNPGAKNHAASRVLLSELIAVEENERRQLARDLHDRVGQNITACQLLLPRLREALPGAAERTAAGPAGSAPGPGALADQLRTLTGELARDLHDIVMALRPVPNDVSLAVALEAYVDDWSARTGVEASAELGGAAERLPAVVEEIAYRIAQHALRNVAEHAQAHHVSVLAERGPAQLLVLVEDDGLGFEPERIARGAAADAHGLAAMRRRAAVLRGSVTIESAPGRGTTVVARLPLA